MPRMYQYPNDYEMPSCDLCGSDCTHRKTIIENAKGTHMHLAECTECGLRFFSPRPVWSIVGPLVADEQKQAETLYANCSFFEVASVEQQKAIIRNYYWAMLDGVKAALGHMPTSYFELGGCVGWFAVFAREYGVTGPFHGVDINAHAAKIAQERQALPYFQACDFADYTPDRQYEFIVCQDYLEHTYYPWTDLQKLAGMLQPGGVMLIKTFVDELDPNHEMLAPPTHAIHWTTPVLRGALERAGLTIKSWVVDYTFMVIIIVQKA